MKQLSGRAIKHIKAVLFLACLLPFLRLVVDASSDALGVNPVEAITATTGTWTLRLLLLTLAVSPLRQWTGWQWLARLRRTIALYAFFYACLHFLTYLVFDQFFDWTEIAKDIAKRPYISVGFISFVLLIPLAVTSTDAMIKRMGGRNWRLLHRLVFVITAGGVFHYFWLVKRDITAPSIYGAVFLALLCIRLAKRRKPRPLPAAIVRPGIHGGGSRIA